MNEIVQTISLLFLLTVAHGHIPQTGSKYQHDFGTIPSNCNASYWTTRFEEMLVLTCPCRMGTVNEDRVFTFESVRREHVPHNFNPCANDDATLEYQERKLQEALFTIPSECHVDAYLRNSNIYIYCKCQSGANADQSIMIQYYFESDSTPIGFADGYHPCDDRNAVANNNTASKVEKSCITSSEELNVPSNIKCDDHFPMIRRHVLTFSYFLCRCRGNCVSVQLSCNDGRWLHQQCADDLNDFNVMHETLNKMMKESNALNVTYDHANNAYNFVCPEGLELEGTGRQTCNDGTLIPARTPKCAKKG